MSHVFFITLSLCFSLSSDSFSLPKTFDFSCTLYRNALLFNSLSCGNRQEDKIPQSVGTRIHDEGEELLEHRIPSQVLDHDHLLPHLLHHRLLPDPLPAPHGRDDGCPRVAAHHAALPLAILPSRHHHPLRQVGGTHGRFYKTRADATAASLDISI